MIRFALDPKRAGYLFAAAIIAGYGLVPIWFYLSSNTSNEYVQLGSIAMLGAGAIMLGFRGRQDLFQNRNKIAVDLDHFIFILWVPFILISILILATAPAIPLVSAIQGGSPDLIALQREQFLKSREGVEGIFVYLNAVFTGALIPYSIALMFIYKYRWRWLLTAAALLFTISFVEKAFFLKVVLPLIYLFGVGVVRSRFGPKTTIGLAAAILLLVTTLSGSGSELREGGSEDFFSSDYAATGPVSHIVWRTIAVPVFTAADGLEVYASYFGSELLWGATSSLFTTIFGMDRVPFERLVFEYQWGQNQTGTGSSNSVYLTEAFVNFGWMGVFVFSFFVGRSLRWFSTSTDQAFRSLWPLYVMGLYSAGLIGILLSNGFLILLLIGAFVNVVPRPMPGKQVKKGVLCKT